ncbi:MAG TPA: acyltransferase family protein, partial [Polyangiaceae bacterium]
MKGFAILSVVCIHAKVGENTLAYNYVVNRAVPVFLILFGISAERWWRHAAGPPDQRVRDWYRTRFTRLLPPVWGFASAWWLIAISTGRAFPEHRWRDLMATYVGYAPRMGTTWFIAVIIQLVLVFPMLRWAIHRAGAIPALLVSAGVSALCIWYIWDIVALGRRFLGDDVPEPGWYYLWIF